MKKPKQYITVKGYEGEFEVTGIEKKVFWFIWAKRKGESGEYCFPVEKTDYVERYGESAMKKNKL